MKIRRKYLILIICFVAAFIIGVGGLLYVGYRERGIINMSTCKNAGYSVIQISSTTNECKTFLGKIFFEEINDSSKPETDDEIISKYQNGNFTVIGNKINPYNLNQEIIILTFFDYKKNNELSPKTCGLHSTSCFVLLKDDNKVEVLTRAYREDLLYLFNVGIEADFINFDKMEFINLSEATMNKIPLIQFIDEKNIMLRNTDSLREYMSFIFVNLDTKQISGDRAAVKRQ